MERNTILAVVLSVLVLITYQSIFPAPKQAEHVKTSQSIATQGVNETTASQNISIANSQQPPTNLVDKSVDYVIKNPTEDIYYTNVGGSLHNIDFIGNNQFPITDVLSIENLEYVPYSGQKSDNETVSLVYKSKDWQIVKNFEIKDRNVINVRMEIKNLSETSILNNFTFTAFEIDESRMDINQSNRESALFEYSVDANNKIFRKGSALKFNDKNNKSEEANVSWVGFRDHYHAFVVKPEFETKGYEIKSLNDKKLNISLKPQEKILAPGESITYNFSIYAGPQNPTTMKKYGQGFEKIFAFSNFPPIEWIAQGIYYLIPWLHNFCKSWGLAIILVSIMLYGITYPMSMKGMMAMRRMQEVQPKIAALRERFKNDPQKLNTEMMEIYRREKINPLGGCLPQLIQMPFFMALYQILWRAQYFQGQGFLWIKDLSQPDRLFILPFSLPFIGNEINILPILTGIIMFLQQKISSKNMIVADEQQAMQQKMMMYFLPVLMAAIFYKFCSAWAVYFLVYYMLSTATQWKIAQLNAKK